MRILQESVHSHWKNVGNIKKTVFQMRKVFNIYVSKWKINKQNVRYFVLVEKPFCRLIYAHIHKAQI